MKHIIKVTYGLNKPIDADIIVNDWGKIDFPYTSYYGRVSVKSIASLWEKYETNLFSKNIRKFKGITDVNDGIKNTLQNSPSNFWYFNNGITMLCDSVINTNPDQYSRSIGIFKCNNISIVNGAQTVGSIGELLTKNPAFGDSAEVQIRIISLANSPSEYSNQITRYTNTQNRIENKDFAALDSQQERLKKELWTLGIDYIYKTGDQIPNYRVGYTIEEATIALACSLSDISLTVQAKSEVGKLWADINKPPYTLIFNSSTTALKLMRCVEVFRNVESFLKNYSKNFKNKNEMIGIHGNRFILHEVFKRLPLNEFNNLDFDFEEIKSRINELTEEIYIQLIKIIELNYAESYLNSLFKNKTKCNNISLAFDTYFSNES